MELIRSLLTRLGDKIQQPLRGEVLSREALMTRAVELAEQTVLAQKPLRGAPLRERFRRNTKVLEHAYFTFAQSAREEEVLTAGAEWILDNYHVIDEQVRDIRRDLPRGYYKGLPKLDDDEWRGMPRVYRLACEFITHTDSVVDVDLLTAFIDPYQDAGPAHAILTIGEIWALPIMLRLAIVENLQRLAVSSLFARENKRLADSIHERTFEGGKIAATELLVRLAAQIEASPDVLQRAAAQLVRNLRAKGSQSALASQWLDHKLQELGIDSAEAVRREQQLQAADQISIGNCITALKSIGSINWRDWFERVNRAHHALLKDPAGIYGISDFMTRDLCRHRIERIARRLKTPETAVVDTLLSYIETTCPAGSQSDPRFRHVGYYLLDDGVTDFLKSLGLRPRGNALRRPSPQLAPVLYFGSSLVLICLIVLAVWRYQLGDGVSGIAAAALLLFLLVPVSEFALQVVQWFATKLVHPQPLPKLDLEGGVPHELSTVVTVQTICPDKAAIDHTIDGLEIRYLGNEDDNILYAVLADLPDASSEHIPGDRGITAHAIQRITALNEKYCGTGPGRFFLLMRHRQWNPCEGRWIGWERKRGKIMEFNRLLRGAHDTSFNVSAGDLKRLQECRFVITLDNDTQLPPGTARKLIETIAHPLNRAIFDEGSNVVVKGYSIIQPRVGITLQSGLASAFARIFSGHSGLDPYTHAVSDVYQDLFAEGSYIGKGIYAIDDFERALHGRVPENALLSHDLFEGIFAGTALASDIELFDEFPSRYHAYARRQHRWTRGDWQLLPWVLNPWRGVPRPAPNSGKWRETVSTLGRWKLFDNLRRSLVAPSLLLALVTIWIIEPASPRALVATTLFLLSFPIIAALSGAFLDLPFGYSVSSYLRRVCADVAKNIQQFLLHLAFLPHQSWISISAICAVLFRIYVSKRRLLEWEPAHATERRLGGGLSSFVQNMYPGLVVTGALHLLVLTFSSMPVAMTLPFFIAWYLSPIIAWHVSRPPRTRAIPLSPSERTYLRGIAHDTWRYFDSFLAADYNYLIPDNLQMVPRRNVAERTSPTNISLSVLSVISAYDLGFIPLPNAVKRLDLIAESLRKLERFRGHFLNWYNIRTLQPLTPRYVSTVDSGNLVGHLIAARITLERMPYLPIVGPQHIQALGEIAPAFAPPNFSGMQLRSIYDLHTLISSIPMTSDQPPDMVRRLATIHEYISWLDHVPLLERLSARGVAYRRLKNVGLILRSRSPSLSLLSKIVNRLLHVETLIRVAALDSGERAELREFLSKLRLASERLSAFGEQIRSVHSVFTEIIKEADFRFLYDEKKKLFVIGYNVDNGQRDQSYYDLLASEARLASLVAIAKGDVSQRHWFRLGRGLTDSVGGKALLSWSGTMFEYLMPLLVMRDFPETLLSRTSEAVVRTQRIYARRRGVPWGISESAYSGVDFEKTYQYRAFGIPGLGLKRGLAEDIVVSPYSTMLALPVDPRAAIRNLRELASLGMRGEFGFYEAVDFTPERLSADESFHIVRSFLAHHQGMSIVAMNNILNGDIFQKRFHAEPAIRANELLLEEKFPARIPVIVPHQAELSLFERPEGGDRAERSEHLWSACTRYPRTRVVSNGRFSVILDNAGSGTSLLDGQLLTTRWRPDTTVNRSGTFFYIRERDSGALWSPTYQPTRAHPEAYEVIFSPDKIEYRRRNFSIGSHLEVTVAPEEPVEIRRLTLTNISPRRRSLELASYGEVALASQQADMSHPAFSKLFVESEFISEHDALLFKRRPRSPHETPLYLFHLVTMPIVWAPVAYHTSRAEFLGRLSSVDDPAALREPPPVRERDRHRLTGPILDPIFSLQTKVEVEPGSSQTVTYVTGIARSREEALQLISKYREHQQITRAFEMAWSQSDVELRHQHFTISQSHAFHHLANALIYNIPPFRAPPEVIAKNHLPQSALWRVGISGDMPIVLLIINDPEHSELAAELLLAHEFLRLRGIRFDLVILNEYPGGYMQNLQEELDLLIRSGYSHDLVDKMGGVHLRVGNHLSEDERILLHATARVVLHGGGGSLSTQLNMSEIVDKEVPSPLPARTDVMKRVAARKRIPITPTAEFATSFGGFTHGGAAYAMVVDDTHRPPAPWCNVVANEEFGFLITESGGGYTWAMNSRENRLSPWANDPIEDRPGEVLYIRDASSGEYWSPTPHPVRRAEPYRVTHHFGYSEFSTQIQGISSVLTVSGSPAERVKWWHLELQNTDPVERKLDIFLYVEWVLGVNREDTYRHLIPGFDQTGQFLYARNPFNIDYSGQVVVLGTSQDLESYTCSRSEFLGRLGDIKDPGALRRQAGLRLGKILAGQRGQSFKLSQSTEPGHDSAAVLHISITLQPGEKRPVQFYMAQSDSLPDARAKISGYRSLKSRAHALAATREHWRSLTTTVQVETPDRAFDTLVNGWLLYQTLSCRMLARSGYYQSSGAIGFRDQLQDSLALLYSRPDLTRRQILLHASRQFVEGDVQHWWHPPSGRGIRTRISDNYLWLPYAVLEYLEKTKDLSLLTERAPFLEGPLLEAHEMEVYNTPHVSDREGTIYEHCILALDRSSPVGPHGLPLIGCGDWNDGMNAIGVEGRGESVWLGWFIANLLVKFAGIVEQHGDLDRASAYRDRAKNLIRAVEEHAWDGAWYRRAYFDDGTPVGSHVNAECKIDSLVQSWSAITGLGDQKRSLTAINSAVQHLVRPDDRLVCLLWPPFQNSDPSPGYIQGYLPGIRENGGQYTHAATWVVLALCKIGDGDRARSVFNLINPIRHTDTDSGVLRYQTEPYVTCGDVYSVPPHNGRGGWSWYTGSSGWLYQVAVEHLLGLQLRGDHIVMRPCLPKEWTEVKITYRHARATFNIRIANKGSGNKVERIELDGILQDGNAVPIPAAGAPEVVHDVLVVLRSEGGKTSRYTDGVESNGLR